MYDFRRFEALCDFMALIPGVRQRALALAAHV